MQSKLPDRWDHPLTATFLSVVLDHELPSHFEEVAVTALSSPQSVDSKTKFQVIPENEQVGFSQARNKSTIQQVERHLNTSKQAKQ
jgi:hypothetical protein